MSEVVGLLQTMSRMNSKYDEVKRRKVAEGSSTANAPRDIEPASGEYKFKYEIQVKNVTSFLFLFLW